MPPRYTYWTILVGGTPTAFRAAKAEELAPTLKQLQSRHPDAVMKWFAWGKVWDSPDQARAARYGEERPGGRGRDWRPGGQHKDPRARFKKPRDVRRREFARKARERDRGGAVGPGERERPPRTGWEDRRERRPDQPRERQQWQRSPDRPRESRPQTERGEQRVRSGPTRDRREDRKPGPWRGTGRSDPGQRGPGGAPPGRAGAAGESRGKPFEGNRTDSRRPVGGDRGDRPRAAQDREPKKPWSSGRPQRDWPDQGNRGNYRKPQGGAGRKRGR